MKAATTTSCARCGSCGALLFTVTYAATTPIALRAQSDVGVFFDEDDHCVARCADCGALTPVPDMNAILTQLKTQGRVH